MLDLTKKVQTKDGRPVEIKFTDGRGDYPICGYIDDDDSMESWTADGAYFIDATNPCDNDLINAPEWHLPDPPYGHEWHRVDGWTEEMLPEGWRPQYVGEIGTPYERSLDGITWEIGICSDCETNKNSNAFWRTNAPLPPPKPKLREVPLCADDVPPGSVIRFKLAVAPDRWWQCQSSADDGLTVAGSSKTLVLVNWGRLQDEFEINRSLSLGKWDATAWEPCHKEEVLS